MNRHCANYLDCAKSIDYKFRNFGAQSIKFSMDNLRKMNNDEEKRYFTNVTNQFDDETFWNEVENVRIIVDYIRKKIKMQLNNYHLLFVFQWIDISHTRNWTCVTSTKSAQFQNYADCSAFIRSSLSARNIILIKYK